MYKHTGVKNLYSKLYQ
jgi:hypothetical protein